MRTTRRTGFSWRFRVEGRCRRDKLVIWTTTPWTLPGNRAISFSHKIAYGLYRVTAAPEDNWAKAGEQLRARRQARRGA